MMASAPLRAAYWKRSGRLPGTNSRLRACATASFEVMMESAFHV
jgi:hypothetical protein